MSTEDDGPPILSEKHYGAPSAFTPESLLREARRQKGSAIVAVPEVCLLDPDGDMVRRLKADGRARRHDGWVCYHTDLFVFEEGGLAMGVVGCAVGAAFAVLVAEELFASGCKLLVSVTSSGQIAEVRQPPYFILIDRALRDEGTSYHYLPPSVYCDAPKAIVQALAGAFDGMPVPVFTGATWTTDAPFRETAEAIAAMRRRGLMAVEMEAAAPLCLRQRAQPAGRLLRACDQSDGPGRGRLRERRSEWRPACIGRRRSGRTMPVVGTIGAPSAGMARRWRRDNSLTFL